MGWIDPFFSSARFRDRLEQDHPTREYTLNISSKGNVSLKTKGQPLFPLDGVASSAQCSGYFNDAATSMIISTLDRLTVAAQHFPNPAEFGVAWPNSSSPGRSQREGASCEACSQQGERR
jgi:hypothetical protein